MRVRRLRKDVAHLEVTAFINLIVVLVPFLLSTAVFTRLSVVDLSLPAQSGGLAELKVDQLQLEVVIRPDALDVGDRIGGLIEHIPNSTQGYDLKAMNTLLYQVKAKFPDEKAASVLAQPDTAYDTLIQVMDAMRQTKTTQGSQVVSSELFPNLSIGDAPRPEKAK